MPTFIVTLELDPQSFVWLDALRRAHFPPERNVLAAHLTLFHKLDADGIVAIRHLLAADPRPPLKLNFSGPVSLGRGVAIAVKAPALLDLRARLAQAVDGRLSPQDRQPFRPHVTIQNKVEPAAAKALLTQLGAQFAPRQGTGRAVQVWEYLGGPWRLHFSTAFDARLG